MDTIVLKIYKISGRLKSIVTSIWLSYLAGISVEHISDSSSIKELFGSMTEFSKISVIFIWVGFGVVSFVWLFNLTFDKIRVSQKSEIKFRKIMKEHTYSVLNRSEVGRYSWGYDKTLCVPKNPGGWRTENVYIDLRNSNIDSDYRFADSSVCINGYNDISYKQYCETNPKIATIRQRDDDKERYSVCHVEKSMKGNRVEVRLQKTKWSQLQFSWDFLRRLNVYNDPITNTIHEKEIEDIFVKTLNHSDDMLVNSFCLHLILVSKNGNAILSKISNIKSNDYPSTWAATIGEQIERDDFINKTTGEIYPDFVTRWVKRALVEEFGIDENQKTEQGISELEEYTDMDSLRVLGVVFEGDIYNVALTCVLKLKIDANTLKSIKETHIDDNEITNEFKECSESEARKILLDYPTNKKEYHPSTYLRLLMFHLYTAKQFSTFSSFIKSQKRKNNLFKNF